MRKIFCLLSLLAASTYTIIDFARISLFTDYCSDNEFNSNIPQPNLNRHLQEALRCSTLIQEHYPDKAQEIETMANLVTRRHVSAINRFQNDPQQMQVYCKLTILSSNCCTSTDLPDQYKLNQRMGLPNPTKTFNYLKRWGIIQPIS